MNSIDRVPGPMASLDAFARLWAPVRQMQQDSLKMANRLAHYQYAAAGNYLDWTLSWSRAATAGATQLLSQETELDSKPTVPPRSRTEDFTVVPKEVPRPIGNSVKAPAPVLSVPASPAA